MADGALKLAPVAGDAHALHGVAGHDGERAAAGELVGIGRVVDARELPYTCLALGYVDGLCGGLHVVPEGACLYLDGSHGRVVLEGHVAARHHEAFKGASLHEVEAAAAALGERGAREGRVHLEFASRVKHAAVAHHLHGRACLCGRGGLQYGTVL